MGAEPKEFEEAVRRYLRLAEAWNAILLMDEVDLFLEATDYGVINGKVAGQDRPYHSNFDPLLIANSLSPCFAKLPRVILYSLAVEDEKLIFAAVYFSLRRLEVRGSYVLQYT